MKDRIHRLLPVASRNAWQIIGYESANQIFSTAIPVGQITTEKLHELLRILTAKHAGLTEEEIVGSLLKRGTRRYRVHLEVRRSNDDVHKTTTYTCGDNPHFVARLCRASAGSHPEKRDAEA